MIIDHVRVGISYLDMRFLAPFQGVEVSAGFLAEYDFTFSFTPALGSIERHDELINII